MSKPRILVVDDNADICFVMSSYLKREGFQVEEAYSGRSALKLLENYKFDLVFCDYRLPDVEGEDLFKEIKKIQPDTEVVIITAYADVKTAIRCMKLGALDYVTKPIHHQEVLMLVKQATEGEKKTKKAPSKKTSKTSDKYVWGPSPQSKKLVKNIDLVAPTDMTVIIMGESGTGKEYVANSIHENSKRKDKPFVAIDCGSLAEELAGSELFGHVKGAFTGAIQDKTGQFELANGGTLFMDEIGNLSYENQVKLLRVLQERKIRKVGGGKDIEIDVRLIVATNEDLQEAVRKGDFREDIYHRLNEFVIKLDPLRNRVEDMDVYLKRFLEEANEALGKNVRKIDDITLDKLKGYYWHGNLRELRNVIKRAVLLANSDAITMECVPEEIIFGNHNTMDTSGSAANGMIKDLKSVVEEAEKNAIMVVLQQMSFNKSKTAERLDIDRKTLYNKMKQYDLL